MAPEYFTIIASVATGVIALAGVWVAGLLTTRRERVAFDRQVSREQREQLEDLFARILSSLDRAANNWGKLPEESLD